jgi:hypothetical protein
MVAGEMDSRDAEKAACSSGHPSQKENYLDTHAPQNALTTTAASQKEKSGSCEPSTITSPKAMSTIKIFSMLD